MRHQQNANVLLMNAENNSVASDVDFADVRPRKFKRDRRGRRHASHSPNPLLNPSASRENTCLPISLSNPTCVKSGLNMGWPVEFQMYVQYSCANRIAWVASHGWTQGMMPAALNFGASAKRAG